MSIQIKIMNFSCIDHAFLEVKPMTILIGPQASGKSVVSKLIYFFVSQIHQQYLRAEEGIPFPELKEIFSTEFCKWFPPSAWGIKNFNIKFSAGPIEFIIKRKRSGSSLSEKVNVKFSEYYESQYDRIFNMHQAAKEARGSEDGDDGSSTGIWEVSFKVKSESERSLSNDLGEDSIVYQLFVPAGRSFFTSMGKAISVFDHGGLLDPVTLRFGRLYSSYRERGRGLARFESQEAKERHNALMFELFGGQIKFDRDKEYIETEDGRKVPFSVMSSGQQELLPLWLTIANFSDVRPTRFGRGTWMIYIEEPEAHTFPSAQSLLIEYLSSLVSSPRHRKKMIITTHSPYVLSKVNNLILGGQVAGKARHSSRRLTPNPAWLRPDSVGAYAIVNRRLVNLIDDDGLIDADYLDSVSNQISEEFLSLLQIAEGE